MTDSRESPGATDPAAAAGTGVRAGGAVPLPASVLERYPRFSCYNSPYPAHDRGCAVDLYPASNAGLSPVAGEVVATRTVRCPDRHYAVDRDHLVVVDVADDWANGAGADLLARVLHVDPAVEPGDRVAVGDSLGEMVRSGFFGQWVDNHLHLGFRPASANPYRASGSLPVAPQVAVTGQPWDGTGTVVETGPTHALLDAPAHQESGSWICLAADDGTPLDGGLVHYSGGGAYAAREGPLSVLGTEIGVASPRAQVDTGSSPSQSGADAGSPRSNPDAGSTSWSGTTPATSSSPPGSDVAWADVAVVANGVRATGLSLFASRGPFGAKLVFHEGHEFAVGDAIEVELAPTSEPIRLG